MSGVPEANNFCTSCGAELEPDTEMCPVCEYPSRDGGRTWDDVKDTREGEAVQWAINIAQLAIIASVLWAVYVITGFIFFDTPFSSVKSLVYPPALIVVATYGLEKVWPAFALASDHHSD